MIQKWIQERADSNNKINWETAILAGTLFLLPLSEKGFVLGLTFCCFFAVLSIWQKKSVLIRLTKVDTIILLWLLWSSFSLWLSEHGSLGHFILTALLPVFLYFFISRRKRTIENERILLQSLWLGAGAVAIWGLWQVFSGNAFMQGDWVDQGQFSILLIRMYGPLYNPNLLAGYLAMVMAFWTGYRVYRSRTRDGMIGIAGLGLLGICLLLTYSRGAWLSLSAVLLGLGGFGRKKGRYLLWGFVGLCGVILLTDSSITERLTSVFNPTGESSSALRLAIWHSSLYIIGDYPIFGIGWGAFPKIYPLYDYFLGENKITIFHAHNLYLQLIVETGIVGFLIWTAIIGLTLQTLWSQIKKEDPMSMGLACAILTGLLGGLTDVWLYNPQIAAFFWLLIGWSQRELPRTRTSSRKMD